MTTRSKPFTKAEWARIQPQHKCKHRVNGLAPPDVQQQWLLELAAAVKCVKELDDAGYYDR